MAIKKDVTFYENLRNEVKLHSGDVIDLKQYEPAMRHLIGTYIRAEVSEKVSAFDNLSLVQLIVERGAKAVKALPEGIRKNEQAVAETIENNVRKLIIDETPINPSEENARELVLRRWYRERLRELVPPLLAKWEPCLGVRVADWRIKKMKTKWGSCSADAGRIWLNLELVKKPVRALNS